MSESPRFGGGAGQAIRLGRGVALGGGLYLTLVAVVSVLTPERQCARWARTSSDDWCIRVADVLRHGGQAADTYRVEFRVPYRSTSCSGRSRW